MNTQLFSLHFSRSRIHHVFDMFALRRQIIQLMDGDDEEVGKKVSLLKSIRWQNSAWSAISEENEPACCGCCCSLVCSFTINFAYFTFFLFYAASFVLRGKMSWLMGQAICWTAAMMESEWRHDNFRVVFSFFCFSSWTFSCFHFPFFSCVYNSFIIVAECWWWYLLGDDEIWLCHSSHGNFKCDSTRWWLSGFFWTFSESP